MADKKPEEPGNCQRNFLQKLFKKACDGGPNSAASVERRAGQMAALEDKTLGKEPPAPPVAPPTPPPQIQF
jgi:hypothetical protein